jgi:hypothetical protein
MKRVAGRGHPSPFHTSRAAPTGRPAGTVFLIPDAIASPVSCSKLSALQSGRLGRRALHFNADHDNDVMVSWPFNDSLSQTVVSQFKVR